MSVDQTTQLIQLILNSVLMCVVCALVLTGQIARLAAIEERIQSLHRQATDEDREGSPVDSYDESYWHAALQLRQQLRRSQVRYQVSRSSVLLSYYALLFAILSCFALAVRGLVNWDGLIPVALAVFVLGVACLLVGVGLALVDLHLSERSLMEEVSKLLSVGKPASPTRFRKRGKRSGLPYRASPTL